MANETLETNPAVERNLTSRAAQLEEIIKSIEQSKELSALYDALPPVEKLFLIRELVR